jgi:hypothetical protein
VFGPDPKISSQEALYKRIHDFVRVTVGVDARVAIAPNERSVTIEAFTHQHEVLAQAWPRVACIGQTRYDVEYGHYKACVYLIKTALQQDGIPPLGRWSDGLRRKDTIYCGQSVDSTAAAIPAVSDAGSELKK